VGGLRETARSYFTQSFMDWQPQAFAESLSPNKAAANLMILRWIATRIGEGSEESWVAAGVPETEGVGVICRPERAATPPDREEFETI
jgi:hypothetical protein